MASMGSKRRVASWALAQALALGSASCGEGTSPTGSTPAPSVEAAPGAAPASAPTVAAVAADAFVAATDDAGRPTLLLGLRSGPTSSLSPEGAARTHLRRLAAVFGARAEDVDRLAPLGATAVGDGGAALVAFRDELDGAEPIEGSIVVLLAPDRRLVALRGGPNGARAPRLGAFALDAHQAAERALADRAGSSPPTLEATGADAAGFSHFLASRDGAPLATLRVRPVWERRPDGLLPAYVVEALPHGRSSEPRRSVIDARDGTVLATRSLIDHDAFAYRVFADPVDGRPLDGPTVDVTPHPTGVPGIPLPAFVAPSLVTIDGLPRADGSFDSWLPPGATETLGLHAESFADRASPDGFSMGDVRPTTSAPGLFDRAYDPTLAPLASDDQSMGSATELFYVTSYLNDYFHASGFDERAGNAQRTNFGRGGAEGDPIVTQAQDSADIGARDNASMWTPEDGVSPYMSVLLWTAEVLRELEIDGTVLDPGPSIALFGPTDYDVSGELAAAVDEVVLETDACSALANDVTGRVELVDRGNCTFREKVANIQLAGGIGVLVVNQTAGEAPPNMARGDAITPEITIPAMGIRLEQGRDLRAAMEQGPVLARLHRQVDLERDGSLDHLVVAHEWGHYLHRRLSVCDTYTCGALAEGYCDFVALHMAIRAGDDLAGAYAVGSYAARTSREDATYFGLRRVPYSIDVGKNALSFRHLVDDEPLPDTHPTRPGGKNSEVHAAGEVWATMLFESYAALRARPGLEPETARRRMADILVAGLRIAPRDATHTESRDALLAAASAIDEGDSLAMAEAFGRRGAGTCAVSAPRTTTDFVGVMEDGRLASRLALSGPWLVADGEVCDTDGILDPGESGHVEVRVANGGPVPTGPITVRIASPTPGLRFGSDTVVLEPIPAYDAALARIPVLFEPMSTADRIVLSAEAATASGCPSASSAEAIVLVNQDDARPPDVPDDRDAGPCSASGFPDGGVVSGRGGVIGGGLGCSVAILDESLPAWPAGLAALLLLGGLRRRRRGAGDQRRQSPWTP